MSFEISFYYVYIYIIDCIMISSIPENPLALYVPQEITFVRNFDLNQHFYDPTAQLKKEQLSKLCIFISLEVIMIYLIGSFLCMSFISTYYYDFIICQLKFSFFLLLVMFDQIVNLIINRVWHYCFRKHCIDQCMRLTCYKMILIIRTINLYPRKAENYISMSNE